MAKKPLVKKAKRRIRMGKEIEYIERFSHLKKKGKHKGAKKSTQDNEI